MVEGSELRQLFAHEYETLHRYDMSIYKCDYGADGEGASWIEEHWEPDGKWVEWKDTEKLITMLKKAQSVIRGHCDNPEQNTSALVETLGEIDKLLIWAEGYDGDGWKW